VGRYQYRKKNKPDSRFVRAVFPVPVLAAIAAWMAGVPVRLHTFTGQPWVHLRGPMRWFARRSDWLIGRLNTRCYADSASQRQFLVEQGIVPAQKLFVIGAGSLDGVNFRRFDPARFPDSDRAALKQTLGIPDNSPVLLFVGRITADKGIRELISAFCELKKAGSPAHLVLAGPFDADGGGIPRCDVENIQDVHIAGYTDRPEAYMAVADILCLPSYREGFGTVVIEAAAMGVPTVGTNIYGLMDSVVDGETGILVPPRDAAALKNALQSLLENTGMRLKMGQAAKDRAIKLFGADQMSEKVIEEYCHLLDDVTQD
jgi:glycosyltransferase involved in cell wall biosynthesis